MAKVVKAAGKTARKTLEEKQATIHGETHKSVRLLSKDTSFSTRHARLDIGITGEGPGKYQSGRP